MDRVNLIELIFCTHVGPLPHFAAKFTCSNLLCLDGLQLEYILLFTYFSRLLLIILYRLLYIVEYFINIIYI